MNDEAMKRVIAAVFDPATDGDARLVEALDELVEGRHFDALGRAIFRALVERRLASLMGRQAIAAAQLRALLDGKRP